MGSRVGVGQGRLASEGDAVNLAALREAAEFLARAASYADAGDFHEAAFAAESADLAALSAFAVDPEALAGWRRVLSGIDAALSAAVPA